MKSKACLILPALLLLAGLAELRATTVLDFQGSSVYVGADTTFNSPSGQTVGSTNYSFASRAFSATTTLSPTSGYTGPVFFGGYEIAASTADHIAINRQQVRSNSATLSTITLLNTSVGVSAATTMSFAALYLFEQANWSTSNSGSVGLGSLTVTHGEGGSSNTNWRSGVSGRWVVENGSTYYISQNTIAESNTTASATITDFSTTLWAVYTPGTALNFDQGSASFSTVNFNNVTAAGVYFENDSFAGTGTATAQYALQINAFTIDAVPEPSPVAMLGATLLGTLALTQWRKKNAAFSGGFGLLPPKRKQVLPL